MPRVENFTARAIFEAACSILSQGAEDASDLAPFNPKWLNILVQEALPYENMRRAYEGDPARPVLAVAPPITAEEDEIPYDDEICRVALVYGLAAQLFLDDDEEYRAQDYRGRFIAALQDSQRVREEKVRDVYA